jgi:hypothetical protein
VYRDKEVVGVFVRFVRPSMMKISFLTKSYVSSAPHFLENRHKSFITILGDALYFFDVQ